MAKSPASIDDMLVHLGRPDQAEARPVNLPVELGSTVVFDTLEAFEAAREARFNPGTAYYGRYGNPTVHALECVVAALDGGAGAVLTSSGVAAISSTLLALTQAGVHLLVADNVYGNTRAFCDGGLTRAGVTVEYFDAMDPSGLAQRIRPETAAVFFEAPGSATFEVPDIPAIAAAARAAGVPSVIDATWATPVFCRPISLGIDVVVYSASKYLSGHSDAMLGVTVAREPLISRLRRAVMQLGEKPGGQEVALVLRGVRTLKIRMAQFDRAGREMAAWFAARPEVRRVLHPALPSCPGHAHWVRDFSGAGSLFGVVFQPCPAANVRAFVDALTHFGIGVSWGGYESLVLPMTPVRTARPWEEDGPLVRFSIGLEDLDTLKTDLAAALPRLGIGED